MLIEISPTNYGPVLVEAVNQAIQKKINAHMVDMGENGGPALVDLWDITQYIPKRKASELEKGFTVRCRVDSWSALNLWGYDTHTLAENGLI